MIDDQYELLLRNVQLEGEVKGDRTGTGTLSTFAQRLQYDLQAGFPLITTKKVHFRSVAVELFWFLEGRSNIGYLRERGVRIWDEWADADGELGPVYGTQWRSWPTPDGGHIDQIATVLRLLREEPDSRRMIVSAWNVAELEKMALPPCHLLFQFGVSHRDGVAHLDCQVYQRSADLFLGVPFNLASYALLTHLVAAQVSMRAGTLTWIGGDCHIYVNHLAQVDEQLSRQPFPLPRIAIRDRPALLAYDVDDLTIMGYRHHPAIPAPVAV